MSSFEPRAWQKDAASVIRANAESGLKKALIYACPGAGKTVAGLLIGNKLISDVLETNTIVVVTPNLAIKSQWIQRARESFGLHLERISDFRKLLDDRLPLGVSGYILSYQECISNRNALRVFTDRFNPVVILDEVHHTAGMSEAKSGNAWGVSVEDAFRNASFVLCTTGTPFRQGNNPIAFVQYNDDGVAVSTCKYTLAQAIRDKVCRATTFRAFDGAIEWRTRAGDDVRHRFADDLPKKLRSERLEAALSMGGKFSLNMLRDADIKLNEIRMGRGVDANAGGLVVGIDTNHANAIADALETISGERPIVVHSKVDDAHDLIREFEISTRKWLVGVSMISEGVDIPRLRVGVYATRIKTPLYFHQFCGRFARMQEADGDERAFVFMPDDSELVAIALEIEDETYHALGEEGELTAARRGNGRGRRRSELEVEESSSELSSETFGGSRFTVEQIEAERPSIERFRRANPQLFHLSDAEILNIKHSMMEAAE